MHVALIPDGNRRFMSKTHIESLLKSYDLGISKFYDFLNWCSELGVKEVTIYALSTENILNRDKREIETLFKVFSKHAIKGLTDKNLHEKKVRVRMCGDRDFLLHRSPQKKLAAEMLSNMEKLEKATEHYGDFTLNLAIAYGGRQEIITAVNKIIMEGGKVTEESLKSHLWVQNDPDLLIRTSEERISNFLLWQSAYSEIYFVPKLWQEFDKPDLVRIIDNFKSRERRYGK
jgi:tritrans,polycis-undecaprenyl-diphosphate synthase [geranylgeranyl-diphosphate specific]